MSELKEDLRKLGQPHMIRDPTKLRIALRSQPVINLEVQRVLR
jgi:hypothetical protein